MRIFFVFMIALILTQAVNCHAGLFGVASKPAPVLNSPDFNSVFGGRDGFSLNMDRCGQVRELEYIALPGTPFKILGELKIGNSVIYQVETEEYLAPPGIRLYVDSRFLELQVNVPPSRKRPLPQKEEVLAALKKTFGASYVWGGNVPEGVPELLKYFSRNLRSSDRERVILAGLDCSGLLYHATAGWTPRNTSQLISFGEPVAIEGKNEEEIVRLLEPLDLIVWNGHLIIVLDRATVIESRLECGKPGNGGVATTPLRQRLKEIMRTRKPVDNWPDGGKRRDVFVIRRWHAW